MTTKLTDTTPATDHDVAEQLKLEDENPHVRSYRERLGISLTEAAQHSRSARAAREARR